MIIINVGQNGLSGCLKIYLFEHIKSIINYLLKRILFGIVIKVKFRDYNSYSSRHIFGKITEKTQVNNVLKINTFFSNI